MSCAIGFTHIRRKGISVLPSLKTLLLFTQHSGTFIVQRFRKYCINGVMCNFIVLQMMLICIFSSSVCEMFCSKQRSTKCVAKEYALPNDCSINCQDREYLIVLSMAPAPTPTSFAARPRRFGCFVAIPVSIASLTSATTRFMAITPGSALRSRLAA